LTRGLFRRSLSAIAARGYTPPVIVFLSPFTHLGSSSGEAALHCAAGHTPPVVFLSDALLTDLGVSDSVLSGHTELARTA